MRFEVLAKVNMSMLVFWVVTPYGLVGGYQRFGGFSPDDGNSMFCQNVDTHLKVHMMSESRRPPSTTWTLSEIYFR
jgi:hypothetical protein